MKYDIIYIVRKCDMMKRNTRIVVSIVGIIIVSLMLLGLTYGYFITRISGNTNEKSVEVVAGNMSIIYTDLSSEVEEIITPGYQTVKAFNIENNGNVPATYSIYLVDVINNFTRTQDITYVLYKLDYEYTAEVTINTDFSDWTKVAEGEYPTKTIAIKTNETIPNRQEDAPNNPMYTYALLITYENANENQNEDQGKTFSAKINIRGSETDNNPYSEGTLAHSLYSDPRVKKNTTPPQFTGVATTEEGLYSAEDDYGTSWYYRGAQPNNYVSFAGFIWRVVRINGDGSIRLILDGTLDKVQFNNKAVGTTAMFNTTPNDNSYIGYMYGFNNITNNVCIKSDNNGGKIIGTENESECLKSGGMWTTPYDATHMNINDSTIKSSVDLFYETYIENESLGYYYGKYLSDTMFCGDKSLASKNIGNSNSGLGYGSETNKKTYYSAAQRLALADNSGNLISTAIPTLKCTEGISKDYSRYSVKKDNILNTNGSLKYPIALLSADELVMAGAFIQKPNQSYYLYDAFKEEKSLFTWWTMTPVSYVAPYAFEFIAILSGNSLSNASVYLTTTDVGVRPVINLKSGILLDGGTGISDDPYKVTLETIRFSFEHNEEYEVIKGTTFEQFLKESGNTKFSVNSDRIRFDDGSSIHDSCSSPTGTDATLDAVIEPGNYDCFIEIC